MNHRALDDGVLVRDSRRHRRAVHAHPEGVHSEPGQRAAVRHDRDRAGHVVRRHGDAPAAGHRRSSRPTRTSPASTRRSAAARRSPGRIRAVCSSGSSRATSASASTRSSRSCGRSSRRCRASSSTCRIRRRFRSADACRRACISSRCRARTSRRCIRRPTQLVDAGAQVAAAAGRDERSAARQSAGERRDRPRARGVARRHGATRSRRRCTTRTARARSRRSTRRTTSTGW